MDLWLVQCLCPSRHAIAASVYDRTVTTPEEHEALVTAEMIRSGLAPVCALCGSLVLRYEHGKLPYATLEEAMAAVVASCEAQMQSRALIDRLRQQQN